MSPKEKNGKMVTTTYEFQFPQPKEKLTFSDMLYNPKDGTCFGRTASSWTKIIIFYAIFYTVLAGLFAICMQGLLMTLDDKRPRRTLEESLVGTNPGLGFRPLSEQTELGSVIHYNAKKQDEVDYWTNLLNEFLEPYKHESGGTNRKVCDFNTTLKIGDVCSVDINNFGSCSPSESYGFPRSTPCIFLKLNKIFDWIPEYYDDINDLPKDMPDDLKDHIRNLTVAERKQVWVSCKGLNQNDVEIIGPIEYIPSRGFPSYYYPYKNIQGYLSPLIAIRFPRPDLHQLISIECRAWAKNIVYSGSLRDRQGSVLFELLLD